MIANSESDLLDKPFFDEEGGLVRARDIVRSSAG
jgi:hypothetical protein